MCQEEKDNFERAANNARRRDEERKEERQRLAGGEMLRTLVCDAFRLFVLPHR